MFSTRPPRVQTIDAGGASPVTRPTPCPDPCRPRPPHGISISLMLSVTALIAVAKIGPSSEPLAAQK